MAMQNFCLVLISNNRWHCNQHAFAHERCATKPGDGRWATTMGTNQRMGDGPRRWAQISAWAMDHDHGRKSPHGPWAATAATTQRMGHGLER